MESRHRMLLLLGLSILLLMISVAAFFSHVELGIAYGAVVGLQGKSGGFRTLIVFRAGTRAIFVHGFAKNERDNIEKDELVALKMLASELLAYDDKAIARVVASGVLVEMTCDEKAIP